MKAGKFSKGVSRSRLWPQPSFAAVASLAAAAVVAPAIALAAVQHWTTRGAVDATGRNAFVMLKGDLRTAVVGPLDVSGPYRLVESSKKLKAQNLRIHRVTGRNLQRAGIRLRGHVDGVQIRDFRLAMRSGPQSPPHLPVGIDVAEGSRISISDGVVQGFRMIRQSGKYTNGDGISSERKVRGLTIRNVVALDNSDGGFDLKSKDTRLDMLRAERNGRNYRFWGTVEAGTLTSIDPRGAHVWAGNGASVRIGKLIARSDNAVPIVQVDGARSVIIESCDLKVPRSTPLVAGSPKEAVKLGRGCQL
jgi:hypothetical protein